MSDSTKEQLQEQLYEFPYHHLPAWTASAASRHRVMKWGFEYACYLDRLSEIVRTCRPPSVLEVGCGDGRFIGLLNGVERRVGVDLSERAISFARAFHPEVEFSTSDVADLTEQFDMVALVEVLEHISDEIMPDFLRSVAARVRPGGHILISVPSLALPVTRKHYRHYDADVLRRQWEDAGLVWRPRVEEYVYRSSRLVGLYERLTMNRYWTVAIHAAESAVWRYVRRRLRSGPPELGRHLVMVCGC